MDSFHVQVPIDRDGRYRWQLRGSDTGFETPFAPWFKIQSITDLPPRVQLFISAGHNGLYDAKEIVALSGEIRDELEVDQTYLEYSINGLPWVTGPDLTSGMSSESNSEAFQIHATARLDWDLAPLSLKDGDLARARLVAVDRNSQRTASQPIQFMITQLDFSVDRYPLLTAKSELLQKLMTWRSALDPPTAQLASNDVFDFLLPLLSEEMNRPDAMELEAISQAIFVLGTLRHDSAPFTESENAVREQVVKAARHFLARTINEGCARDIEKLDQHISRIADGVMDREIAWLERQVQLAHEYYDASTVLVESTSVGLTQSMINNCDNLARQLKDLQQRMDLQLDQEIKREGLRDELKYQKDQLGYRISNPHLEGSIPNLCIESIVELNRISQSNAVRLNDLAKNIRKRDELRAKMLDATDASVISELELQLIESMERIGEQCATIVAIQAAELVSHKAQKEFSVTRVSDSHLIAQVFDVSLPKTIGDSVKAKVYELNYRDTLIKSVQTLDVGNDVLDLLDDLQQLARRERWETSQLELRLGHPMRWEYLQKGFDLAVPEMQQLATLRELANIVNTIRYNEISRSASEQISQRRWDKNRKTSAGDDLDQMLVQFREHVLDLQKIMEQAREELRKLLPEEYAGEESLASAAQNEAQASENAAFRQLTEQSPAEALKTLEEELKRDANMRSSLDKISEEIAIDAMEQLRLAAKQEEQLALQLEHNDPVLREKKRTAIARMTDLANRAQEVLRHPLEQARATASRGAAGDVAKALEKPQEALRNATTAAQSVGEQMSMDAIKAAAKQVAEALDEAERGLASADEQIDSLEENEIEKRPQDRQRTKEQMEALQRRTQDNAVRDMAQRQKRWSDMVQQRNRDIERTGRELNNAQKNLEKAQAELAQHPDEEWREQQTRDAANQVRLSEQAMAGLSQSLEILEQMRQAAADEAQQAKDAPMAPIEAANPAAALSNRLIAQSDQRVEQLKSEADALSNALLEIAGPELDQRTLNTVKENQQRVQRQLTQVQENLERVARHETRVGRVEMGEKFAAAAERVQELSQQQVQEADNQSSAALKTLDSQRLATGAELGKGVQQAVESAQRALESQADALAAQIDNRIANGDSAEGESGTSESTSAKKAMTLDDLDRALHGSQPSSAPGASSEEDGTVGGQLKPLPERSLDASPTLAAEREMAQRNAARQIMQMAEGETNELGESSEVTSTVSGNAVAGTPRQGELDGNGLNRETTGSSKAKDDWWRLREQKTEDVIEGKQRVISESYRKQIEAYFRGIAERSQP
jgi:hypothetical protein